MGSSKFVQLSASVLVSVLPVLCASAAQEALVPVCQRDNPGNWSDRDPTGGSRVRTRGFDDSRAAYILLDANYNVVALVSGNSEPGSPPPGTILEQYAYEPYGAVIVSESFADHAVNRVGHQGLFFERLDGDFTQRTVSPTDNGLYYNRNRWYSPHLGRFMQRDPNETGMPILAALAMNGDSLDVFFGGFNLTSLYADGMNLYQYEGSNPVSGRDPAGLFSLLDTLETAANSAIITGMTWAMAYPTAMQLAGGILAAANLYMMVVDPDFQAMVLSQPGAMGFIEADIQAILSAGGTIKGLLRASGAAALALRGAKAALVDWSGYPAGIPKPYGPFRVVEGAEYDAARAAANEANKSLHRLHPEWAGKHIHEIHPIKLGGDPANSANKIAVDPSTHYDLNTFWARVLKELE